MKGYRILRQKFRALERKPGWYTHGVGVKGFTQRKSVIEEVTIW